MLCKSLIYTTNVPCISSKLLTDYPSRAPGFSPDFLMTIVLLIYLVFYVVLSCVFTFLVRWFNVRYNFCIRTIFGLPLLELFVRVFMSLFCYLCLLVYNGSRHAFPICVTCRVSNKMQQELQTLREHPIVRDPHLFGFLCWSFFSFAYLRSVFGTLTVDIVSALFILYWLSLRFSLTFICTSVRVCTPFNNCRLSETSV